MGAAVGDYDRDGDQDWFVTSIHDADGSSGFGRTGNRLYRNLGDGRFEDATGAAGGRAGGWGWGACLADFDNDGHPDLFHTNGWFDEFLDGPGGELVEITEFLEDPSRLFMSDGDGTFTERASALGIRHTGQGRGAVCTDDDGDGRVDIFIANHGAAPSVHRNVFGNANHWLAVDLVGRHANPRAIGARVAVRTASGRQVQEVRLGGSSLSQAPPVLHFGLGGDRIVQSIAVRWPGPGHQVSRLGKVAADRRLTIRQPAPEGLRLSIVRGAGSGLHGAGATVSIEAAAGRGHDRFSHWTSEGGGAFDDARSPATTYTTPANAATVFAHFLPGPPASGPGVSVARRWIEVLLQAIRDDRARPTVHARNLFHLSAAMYDAWILAENWWPYQRPSFVTPPFAGYVSGHSTFSRAAAEVLTALTGDPFFPGGVSDFRIEANEFLVFERGPCVDMTLQWATYRDAADQCSLSRIWGGIHPPADDIAGRRIGAEIGRDAFVLATSLFRCRGRRPAWSRTRRGQWACGRRGRYESAPAVAPGWPAGGRRGTGGTPRGGSIGALWPVVNPAAGKCAGNE